MILVESWNNLEVEVLRNAATIYQAVLQEIWEAVRGKLRPSRFIRLFDISPRRGTSVLRQEVFRSFATKGATLCGLATAAHRLCWVAG